MFVNCRGRVRRGHPRAPERTLCIGRHASVLARPVKAGNKPDARIINTSSGAGLRGSVGQAVYRRPRPALRRLRSFRLRKWAAMVTANAIAVGTADDRRGLQDMMAKSKVG
jgi:NAD(P)-dependent dehydrogenase (short-subunit alcohol dehydrogenase family)